MTELEIERIEYQNSKEEVAPQVPDVFQMSIEMLEAARKQILGY